MLVTVAVWIVGRGPLWARLRIELQPRHPDKSIHWRCDQNDFQIMGPMVIGFVRGGTSVVNP